MSTSRTPSATSSSAVPAIGRDDGDVPAARDRARHDRSRRRGARCARIRTERSARGTRPGYRVPTCARSGLTWTAAAGPEGDVLEGAPVRAHRDLVVGAAVDEVEHDPRAARAAPAGGRRRRCGRRPRIDLVTGSLRCGARHRTRHPQPTRRPSWPTPSTGRCPQLTPENELFWTAGADGELRFQRCTTCGALPAPARADLPVLPQPRDRGRRACRGAPPSSASPSTTSQWLPDLAAAVRDRDRRARRGPARPPHDQHRRCDPDDVHIGQAVRCGSSSTTTSGSRCSSPTGGRRGRPRAVAPDRRAPAPRAADGADRQVRARRSRSRASACRTSGAG